MLRFSSITLLKPIAIILGSASGIQTLLTRILGVAAFDMCRRYMRFFYRFRERVPRSVPPPQTAYLLKVCGIAPAFSPFCPLPLLCKTHARGMFLRPPQSVFPTDVSPDALCPYRVIVAGEERPPPPPGYPPTNDPHSPNWRPHVLYGHG